MTLVAPKDQYKYYHFIMTSEAVALIFSATCTSIAVDLARAAIHDIRLDLIQT